MTAWWPVLVEPAEPSSRPAKVAESPPSSGQRLSRSGQILLGTGVSLMALLLYTLTLQWSLKSNQQFQFCQPLSLWGAQAAEGERQVRTLIDALKGATASQKVRLRQQTLILQTESERLCELVIRSRAQEEALLVVATASLCLLSLTILQGLAEGLVNNTNRTLKTVQISTTVVLVISVAFLQLGQEVRNTGRLFQLYRWHRDLQQQVASALANQDRPGFLLQAAQKLQREKGKSVLLAPPLSDSDQVAMLIRAVDAQLQSLPPLPVNLDESAVRKMFGWMSKGLDDAS
ncbi:MAG: hypothetical protein ACK587_09980 [Cyanobacteriota bacterium]|jgi:hypothetical protein